MTRHHLHRRAVGNLVRRLRSKGYDVERLHGCGGVELRINGFTVAVRVSTTRLCNKKVHGGAYQYRYAAEFWNLHQHNRRNDNPDFWLLVCAAGVYVVPNALVAKRLTLQLLELRGKKTPRPCPVRQYLNRFELLLPELLFQHRELPDSFGLQSMQRKGTAA